MKSWHLYVAMVVGLMLGARVQAAVIAFEPFDYTDTHLGTADGSANSGGAGFSSDWSTPADFATDNLNLSTGALAAGSLVYPAGTSLTSSGVRVREVGSNIVAGSTFGGNAKRTLSTLIDTDTESTYYFSFLAKKRPQGGSFFAVSLQNAANTKFFSSGSGSGSSGIRIGRNSNTTAGAGTVANGGDGTIGATESGALLDNETYMFLGKMVFHAGATPEEYYLNVYRTGVDTVPATEGPWTYSRTSDVVTGLSGSVLSISTGGMSGVDADTNVDEIRFSTDYSDAAIPEPGTLGLLGLAGLVALRRRQH